MRMRAGAPQGLGQNLTESIYIAGFGAIFSIRVDFPLLPPPEGTEPKQPDIDTGNLWEQTRREIYSPPTTAPGVQQELRIRQQRSPYDARRVEELKGKLIESLKQAANIRALRLEDCVVIAVTGPGQPVRPLAGTEGASIGVFVNPQGEAQLKAYIVPRPENQPNLPGGITPEEFQAQIKRESALARASLDRARPFAQTCLTIRAKKADIDEFAKGTITVENFKQKLEIIIY